MFTRFSDTTAQDILESKPGRQIYFSPCSTTRVTDLLITLERVPVVLHAAMRRVMKTNLTARSSTVPLTKNAL